MKLLLDVGNTRLKWALEREPGQALPIVQALVHAGDPARSFAALIEQWSEHPPASIWVANVTGQQHSQAMVDACKANGWGATVNLVVSPAQCAGWRSAYIEPHRLGVDRFLMMLALWQQRRSAFCVASAGTALTFDAVDAGGQHLGGVIATGLAGMVQATLGNTRFATGLLTPGASSGLGRDTESCVQLGAVHAAVGLLQRLQGQCQGEAVLCGGDASILLPALGADWQAHDDLVLAGLASYANSIGQ